VSARRVETENAARCGSVGSVAKHDRTVIYSTSDMCRHSSVSVEVNDKIPDEGNRQNGSGADSDWRSRDLMLMTTGRAPKDFSLGGVELQPIGAHLRRYFIDADRQPEGEIINVIRPTESVNLGVVGIKVKACHLYSAASDLLHFRSAQHGSHSFLHHAAFTA